MKNMLFILLMGISQIALGQMGSRPISEFTGFDTAKEILLDVRTKEEFNTGHIPGALNIDWFSANFDERASVLDRHKTIYVYCQKGGRSLKSQARLKALGFLHVIDLEGGFGAYPKN